MPDFSKMMKRLKKRPFCSVVVLAAGSSTRAGRDKLFYPLQGMPVLAYSLLEFQRSEAVDEIVLVTRADKIPEAAALCEEYGIDKAHKILCGGATRAESSLVGVSEADSRAELIAIHDGARPFVTETLLTELIHDALLYQAAAPGVPLRDTVKHIEKGCAVSTVPRDETMAVQTPQVFRSELIKGALTRAVTQNLPITDDCSAVEAMGFSVRMTPGSAENIKLTLPVDFCLAEAILKSRNEK